MAVYPSFYAVFDFYGVKITTGITGAFTNLGAFTLGYFLTFFEIVLIRFLSYETTGESGFPYGTITSGSFKIFFYGEIFGRLFSKSRFGETVSFSGSNFVSMKFLIISGLNVGVMKGP